jgi:RNA polymerase sigma factor (sigma-70 family)
MKKKLIRRKTCAWPGCKERPVEKGNSGLCLGHQNQSGEINLKKAYFLLSVRLHKLAAAAMGRPETVPPGAPGPRELTRLAKECAQLSLTGRIIERPTSDLGLTDERVDQVSLARMDPVVSEALDNLEPEPPADASWIRPDDWAALRAVLETLSPTERKALLLVRGEGKTYQEAAKVIGCGRGNVSTLLTRAEAKIAAWRQGKGAQSQLLF